MSFCRSDRVTVQEREQIQLDEERKEEKKKKQMDDRRKSSRRLVEDLIRKERHEEAGGTIIPHYHPLEDILSIIFTLQLIKKKML